MLYVISRAPEKKGCVPLFGRGWQLVSIGALCGPFLIIAVLLINEQASAQNSLAGDAAGETERKQLESQPYTYKAGDFKLLVVPSLELDYNDNVNLAKTDEQSDFILKPFLQLTASYPISQQSLLEITTGVGYDYYLEHHGDGGVRVSSDSRLSFDLRIKDFLINFHDNFSYTQDPSTEASVAGTATYGGLMNTAGLSATWDLENVVSTLGYDHQNFNASSDQFKQLDRGTELPLARVGLKVRPNLTVGAEGSASFTRYDEAILNNNESYSAGVYADWQRSSFLEIHPRAGYVIYQFQQTSESQIPDPTGGPIETQNLSTWYASLDVTHQVSEPVSYTLSVGHELRLGTESDAIEDTYVRAGLNWMIIKDLSMRTSLRYEHGNQGAGNVMGNLTETYDYYQGELTFGYPLMKKLMLSLDYRLTLRASDVPDREYSQNVVAIKFSYRPQ
jgi:hypothetical protein